MLKVSGGQKLKGEVVISGSKNASLPIISASLLFKKVRLNNVPRIGDIFSLIEILESIGSKVVFEGNTLIIENNELKIENLNTKLVKKLRASILLISGLLYRFGKISFPYPGGCNIGKRPIDEHLNGLEKIGYKNKTEGESIVLEGETKTGVVELNARFAVTATENLIIANVLRKGETIINLAAIEPHVVNMVDLLNKAGAKIELKYNHTIIISGVEKLDDEVEFDVVSDYIESGTFIIMGAIASENYIDIKNARINDLTSFLDKISEAGVKFEDLGNDTLRVYRQDKIRPVNIQTNIFPGFPTDLQSPFAILMTKAEGISKIQEIMFESRLNYLIELEAMKGHQAMLNPHEALIFGKTQLKGTTVSSWDLRAGVAMIIAGLVATGDTYITKVEYIERGYENIIGKIEKLGAKIETIETEAGV